MNYLVVIILFTAIGILFLYITIACKIVYHFLKHLERLIVQSDSDVAMEIATRLYKLNRDYLSEMKQFKVIKRSQTHSQKREREILKLLRVVKKAANRPIRVKVG